MTAFLNVWWLSGAIGYCLFALTSQRPATVFGVILALCAGPMTLITSLLFYVGWALRKR